MSNNQWPFIQLKLVYSDLYIIQTDIYIPKISEKFKNFIKNLESIFKYIIAIPLLLTSSKTITGTPSIYQKKTVEYIVAFRFNLINTILSRQSSVSIWFFPTPSS